MARAIYAKIGGRSPILEETKAQARALERALSAQGHEGARFHRHALLVSVQRRDRARSFGLGSGARGAAAALSAILHHHDGLVVEGLGPGSSEGGACSDQARICCYPWSEGFIDALADSIRETFAKARPGVAYRLLLSAHGLPKRLIAKGDPYQWQVGRTAEAIVERLGMKGLDWAVCYQSRVGPLEWIGPSTDAEIRRAGREGKGVVVAPVAFVSEHSETLVELDIDYAELAHVAGVPDYLRAPTVGTRAAFIEGACRAALKAAREDGTVNCGAGRICPPYSTGCGFGGAMR